jgi:hypothetical protein
MTTLIHTLHGPIDLDDPDPAAIHLEDIAWSLACNPRFNAHTRHNRVRRFYSVAEHSVLVSLCPTIDKHNNQTLSAWALLHDSFEAFAHDVVRPLRAAMLTGLYALWEERFYRALAKRLNLKDIHTTENNPALALADDALLAIEIHHLTNIPTERHPLPIWNDTNPWSDRIPHGPRDAYAMFLRRAKHLGIYHGPATNAADLDNRLVPDRPGNANLPIGADPARKELAQCPTARPMAAIS